MKRISLSSILGLAVLSTSAFANISREAEFIPGEVVVKVKAGQLQRFLSKRSSFRGSVVKELNTLAGQFVVVKSQSRSTVGLVSDFKSLPEVVYAEPNFIYKAITVPTLEGTLAGTVTASRSSLGDAKYGKLWGLKNTGNNEPDPKSEGFLTTPGVVGADIDAERAWGITRGSKNVVIAVIDTGIDYNHEDLKNNMWVNTNEIAGNGIDDDGNGYIDDIHGWNAVSDNGDPLDDQAHGSHCAGTIGAEHNAIGVAGVMADVSLMAVKFLDSNGSGNMANAVEAIDYATKMNVDIMSNSWGGGGFSQALQDSITAAKNKGIVFVAAAGNSAANNDLITTYPVNYPVENIVGVASHTAQDTTSSFTNYGKKTIHVAGPGSNILSTTPGNTYKVYSGTSMATPHVSGVIGLLLSETGRLPMAELKERLMATTTPVGTYLKKTIAGGRVNAYNLLTDTRPARLGPDENAWVTESLSEVFETAHPYANNTRFSKTYTFPNAKYVKFIIEKMDTEARYDYLKITDGTGTLITKVDGKKENFETDYFETASATVEFVSDNSTEGWGVVIKEVKVIY